MIQKYKVNDSFYPLLPDHTRKTIVSLDLFRGSTRAWKDNEIVMYLHADYSKVYLQNVVSIQNVLFEWVNFDQYNYKLFNQLPVNSILNK